MASPAHVKQERAAGRGFFKLMFDIFRDQLVKASLLFKYMNIIY